MNLITSGRDRYPGLRSFEQDEQQLFKGREREVEDLLAMIRNEQIVVLFSKSGLGKSSLLNAGVSPQLRQCGYWPIRIRFQMITERSGIKKETGPLNIVVERLEEEYQKFYDGKAPKKIPALDAGSNRLWEEIKVRAFPENISLIFVFDQFEEFFNYEKDQRKQFFLSLAELMHDRPPTRVSDKVVSTKVESRTFEQMAWCQQPNVKCLFAIRSDRLSEMDSLRAYIPLILQNRYELEPLFRNAALHAIQDPGMLKIPSLPNYFTTARFTYHPALLELIISKLSDKNDAIEGAQLQMICNYIEQQIKFRQKTHSLLTQPSFSDTSPILVDQTFIKDEAAVDAILGQFYKTQLEKLGLPVDIDMVGRVIEEELIEGGVRVGCHEMRLKTELGDQAEPIIRRLQELRLIRAEITHLGFFYELSHDTLVRPVEAARLERLANKSLRTKQDEYQQREVKLKRILAGVVAAVLLFGTFGFLYTAAQDRLKKRIINYAAEQQFALGRHYKAFRLWKKNGNSEKDYRSFVPFSGIDAYTDGYRALIAVKYNDGLEVFRAGPADSIYNWLRPLALSINVNDKFEVAGNTLITYNDSSLTVYRPSQNFGPKPLATVDLRRPDSTVFTTDHKSYKLSPTGEFLLVQLNSGMICLYHINEKGLSRVEKFSELTGSGNDSMRIDRIMFSPNETLLLMRESKSNQLYSFNLRDDLVMATLRDIRVARLSSSGRFVALVDFKGGVWLLDTQKNLFTPQKITTIPDLKQIFTVAFVRGETRLLITSGSTKSNVADRRVDKLDLISLDEGRNSVIRLSNIRLINIQPGQDLIQVLDQKRQWLLYNSINNAFQPTRFNLKAGSQVNDSWKDLCLVTDAQDNLSIYDLGRQIHVKPKILNRPAKRIDAKFCSVRGLAFPQLAVLYPDSLQLIDFSIYPKLRYYKAIKGKYAKMNLIGDLIQLEAVDGFKTLVFADGRKNSSYYLDSYVYPALNSEDQEEFKNSTFSNLFEF